MAKATKSKKKPIDQYDHKGKKRVNNPPVGLVTPETDKETGKKKYAYDPHLDPSSGDTILNSSSPVGCGCWCRSPDGRRTPRRRQDYSVPGCPGELD
jgi:hypothetical protein